MRLRHLIPLLALLAAAMAIPSAAHAKTRYVVGFGDQHPQLFANADFQSLGIKKVRLIVPYDYATDGFSAPIVNDWITAAQAQGKEVMVAFQGPTRCVVSGRYSTKRKGCKAPTPAAYLKRFKAFRQTYPAVKVFQPWNEINSKSQPTYKSPKRAAQYYNAVKKNCKGCKVVAGDFLDSSTVFSYVKKFRRYVKGSPKLWGLHNYSDVNRPKQKGKYTKGLTKLLPGEIWLTETGGLVKFEKNFPYSPSRASKATKNLFKLADQLSRKRRGSKSRVTRVYPYTFFGETRDIRFDAGIVGPITAPAQRPAFKTFKKLVKKRSK